MWKPKRKPVYSQLEIKEQQAIVAEAIRLREDLPSGKGIEYDRATQAVESAQEVLNYMLDEVNSHNSK